MKTTLWTQEEDSILYKWGSVYGPTCWNIILVKLNNKTEKECSSRYSILIHEHNSTNLLTERDATKLLSLVWQFKGDWCLIFNKMKMKCIHLVFLKWQILLKQICCRLNYFGIQSLSKLEIANIRYYHCLVTNLNESNTIKLKKLRQSKDTILFASFLSYLCTYCNNDKINCTPIKNYERSKASTNTASFSPVILNSRSSNDSMSSISTDINYKRHLSMHTPISNRHLKNKHKIIAESYVLTSRKYRQLKEFILERNALLTAKSDTTISTKSCSSNTSHSSNYAPVTHVTNNPHHEFLITSKNVYNRHFIHSNEFKNSTKANSDTVFPSVFFPLLITSTQILPLYNNLNNNDTSEFELCGHAIVPLYRNKKVNYFKDTMNSRSSITHFIQNKIKVFKDDSIHYPLCNSLVKESQKTKVSKKSRHTKEKAERKAIKQKAIITKSSICL